jgi:hypothetical protein
MVPSTLISSPARGIGASLNTPMALPSDSLITIIVTPVIVALERAERQNGLDQPD